jgi:hypothetical protein
MDESSPPRRPEEHAPCSRAAVYAPLRDATECFSVTLGRTIGLFTDIFPRVPPYVRRDTGSLNLQSRTRQNQRHAGQRRALFRKTTECECLGQLGKIELRN